MPHLRGRLSPINVRKLVLCAQVIAQSVSTDLVTPGALVRRLAMPASRGVPDLPLS